jgi:hypothetical protein
MIAACCLLFCFLLHRHLLRDLASHAVAQIFGYPRGPEGVITDLRRMPAFMARRPIMR